MQTEDCIWFDYDCLVDNESRIYFTISSEKSCILTYTYESPGEGKTTPLVSSVTTNGKETEYTYDAFGNILTITEDGVLQHSYTYDARNQLVGETSGTDSYVYSYDAGGNLVSVQKNGEVIKSYTYGDASWKDLLTAFNGQSIKQMKAKENECRNRDFVCRAQ